MQDVRPDRKAVLVATSDWHFRLTTPKSRAEEDWMEVQNDALYQMYNLCAHNDDCDLVIAGDVFDDGWRADKCPPLLVNQAINWMQCFPGKIYVVAGQHDLPNHRLDKIGGSAIQTLVEAGVVQMLRPSQPFVGNGICLYGRSWGEGGSQDMPEPKVIRNTDGKDKGKALLNVVALHAYCWNDDSTRHKDCKDSDHALKWRERLKGYDVAIFGDNHKGFLRERDYKGNGPVIYNTGGPLNRNSDERGAKRHVGLIYADGMVEKHYLNLEEKWKDAEDLVLSKDPAENLQSEEFLKQLAEAGPQFFDFCASMLRHLDKQGVRTAVRDIVTKVLAKAKGEA